jgi:hypothetical protein
MRAAAGVAVVAAAAAAATAVVVIDSSERALRAESRRLSATSVCLANVAPVSRWYVTAPRFLLRAHPFVHHAQKRYL